VVVSTPPGAADARPGGATGLLLDVRGAGAPGLVSPAAAREEVHL
jgi:hypothetical protein